MKEYVYRKKPKQSTVTVKAEPAFMICNKTYIKTKPYPKAMGLKEGYNIIDENGKREWIDKESFENNYILREE